MPTVNDFLTSLDVSTFRALNDFCCSNPTFDRIAVHFDVLRAPLFMGIVGLLWYQPDENLPRRREMLVAMMVAVGLSLFVNRGISTLLPYRVRPMYGSIGANLPSFKWVPDLEHWSSFPSDNATYLFAITAGFWLISRRWGLVFGLIAAFLALTPGLSRHPLSK